MENFWAEINKGAQNIASHWASYTILFSFFLYVLGYLALRFHLAVLGVSTDLSVIDERYLFTGNKFLIYLISSIPSLLLLVFLLLSLLFLSLVAPIYLLHRLLPLDLRTKVAHFFQRQRQNFKSWWLVPNRLGWLGIFFVRPAWAHSCGCKSRRKLITANEVKRNCARVTERGEEALIVICEPMDKNRIEGVAEQGERA